MGSKEREQKMKNDLLFRQKEEESLKTIHLEIENRLTQSTQRMYDLVTKLNIEKEKSTTLELNHSNLLYKMNQMSVNSISSIPSPVYQCKKALRRNIAVNCSLTRLNISWIAVELPMKVVDILSPLGGMSQTEDLMLFGIHSTKYDEFLFWTFNICSSTSLVDIRPRNMQQAVK